ncbi:TadE/TadG family type IV pilus assembly protein, partial [Zhengella mangrovi]|uniref:TadE/TadG family type IV pilus assembly protein n=1 Tax=Zhengella mangrovi TaxID=1982044 RepID=UPI001054BA02
MINHFWRDRRGNFTTLGGMLFFILALGAGVALNLVDIENRRSEFQQAIDSAVLAAAARPDLDLKARIAIAENMVGSNSLNDCTDSKTSFQIANDVITGSLYCQHVTLFNQIVNPGFTKINVDAAAKVLRGDPMCILALNPSASKALLASGGSNIVANGCSVHVNSSSTDAVVFSGGATLSSKSNCFVGGVKQGLSDMTPPPEPSCDPVNDPFKSLLKPATGSCDYTNFDENTD